MTDPVVIAAHDPSWARKFEEARDEIRRYLPHARGIEHIGSTAVPGLAAKPVIDVLVGLASWDEVLAAPARFEGWEFPSSINDQLSDRRFGKKAPGGERTHHVHVVVFQGEEWNRLVGFRDALRADPELRARYQELKRELAEKYRDEREKYTAAKTDFILEAIKR